MAMTSTRIVALFFAVVVVFGPVSGAVGTVSVSSAATTSTSVSYGGPPATQSATDTASTRSTTNTVTPGVTTTNTAVTRLTGCPSGPIDTSGIYVLTQNITAPADKPCIFINSSDVVLDGNGHTLTGKGSGSGDGHPIAVQNASKFPAGSGQQFLSNVTIRNIRVVNWSQPIQFRKVNNTIVKNTVIRDSFRSTPGGGGGLEFRGGTDHNVIDARFINLSGIGIYVPNDGDQATRVRIVRTNIKNNSNPGKAHGIWVGGGPNNIIRNNTISNNSGNGIKVLSRADNSLIANNTIQSNAHAGILIESASRRNRIIGNTITKNPQGIVVRDRSDNATIIDNTVQQNKGNGIELSDDSGNSLVHNNTVRRNKLIGIVISDDSGQSLVRGNTVSTNGDEGVRIQSDNVTIKNNILSNHTKQSGPSSGDGLGIRLKGSFDQFRMADNVIRKNRVGIGVQANKSFRPASGIIVRNRIVDNIDSGVRFSSFAPVETVDIHHNTIAKNGGHGVKNERNDAIADATHNWWGSPSGPSSPASASQNLTDPFTGALANGSGDTVSENGSNPGVSNVHFDPWRTTTPTPCPDITSSGHHTLTTDIINSSERYCINVTASDVVLDGSGHMIDGIGGDKVSQTPDPPIGVFVSGHVTNVTVTNLTVADWETGIAYRNTTGDISHTAVKQIDLDGVAITDSTVNVSHTTITAGDDGIQVGGRGIIGVDDPHVTITNTTIMPIAGNPVIQRGVRINGGSNVILANATIRDAAITGVLINVLSEARIVDTSITRAEIGVEIRLRSAARIERTVIANSSRDGVRVALNSTTNLTGNNITNTGHNGIVLNDSRANITRNVIRDTGKAGIVLRPSAPANQTEIHQNSINRTGTFGVLNENTTQGAIVNATHNFWGRASGPSSNQSDPDAPFADPVTGTLANGAGTAVSEGPRPGISNVHFDPIQGTPPATHPLSLTFSGSQRRVGTDRTATVDLILSAVPTGLSGYQVTVRVKDASIVRIEGASYPDQFGLTEDPQRSDNNATIGLKATDINEAVEPGSRDVKLAQVTLRGLEPGETTLTVAVEKIDDDEGDRIDPDIQPRTIEVVDIVLVCEECDPPTDPDNDDLFEDVNGNDRLDFNDVVTLFRHMDSSAIRDFVSAYDFNQNERIDFDDIVRLFEEI